MSFATLLARSNVDLRVYTLEGEMRHLKRVTSNLNPTQACISRTISVSRDTRLRVSFSVFDWTPVGGRRNFGGIAQLVEHVLCKHEVTGSMVGV